MGRGMGRGRGKGGGDDPAATCCGCLFIALLICGIGAASNLDTWKPAREYQLNSEDTWYEASCEVVGRSDIVKACAEQSGDNSGCNKYTWQLKLEVTMSDKDDGSALYDGKTFQARKYAVWTARKLVPKLHRRFDEKRKAKKFEEMNPIGTIGPCYYKPGKGDEKPKRLAMKVGGNIYSDEIEAVSGGTCSVWGLSQRYNDHACLLATNRVLCTLFCLHRGTKWGGLPLQY